MYSLLRHKDFSILCGATLCIIIRHNNALALYRCKGVVNVIASHSFFSLAAFGDAINGLVSPSLCTPMRQRKWKSALAASFPRVDSYFTF